jgi:hypothetical protein
MALSAASSLTAIVVRQISSAKLLTWRPGAEFRPVKYLKVDAERYEQQVVSTSATQIRQSPEVTGYAR